MQSNGGIAGAPVSIANTYMKGTSAERPWRINGWRRTNKNDEGANNEGGDCEGEQRCAQRLMRVIAVLLAQVRYGRGHGTQKYQTHVLDLSVIHTPPH